MPPSRTATRWLTVAVSCTTVLALAGCRGTESAGTGEGEDIIVRGSMPFSGPLAVYGTLSGGLDACFKKVNAEGGVDGRQIDYSAVDDGYEPTRAVTNARRFIQSDNAFATITFGGPPSFAVAPIAAQDEALQIAIAGNGPLSDTEKTPFTRAWFPDNRAEARAVTEYMLEQNPNARIGVLYINSDTGTDYLAGVQEAVDAQDTATIVAAVAYESTDATVNSQVNQLRNAGADTVVAIPLGAIPFQMMNYIQQIGWTPMVSINESSSGIKATMSKMGDSADGALSAHFVKDPADPQYAGDEAVEAYRAAVVEYGGGTDPDDFNTMKGYALCEAMVAVLNSLDEVTPTAFRDAWDTLPPTDLGVLLDGVQLEGGEGGRLINTFQVTEFADGQWLPVDSAQTP